MLLKDLGDQGDGVMGGKHPVELVITSEDAAPGREASKQPLDSIALLVKATKL